MSRAAVRHWQKSVRYWKKSILQRARHLVDSPGPLIAGGRLNSLWTACSHLVHAEKKLLQARVQGHKVRRVRNE
jgi:hypothetical protein